MTIGSIHGLATPGETWSRDVDVVVIGAGAAGMTAALDVSRRGYRVILMCKSAVMSGSTLYAQGGLAAVTSFDDSFDAHVSDTLAAGAGLSRERPVRELVRQSPATIRYLSQLGAHFDAGSPGLEGGHSHRRIIHAGGDAIGAEVHRTLRDAILRSRVEILEYCVAIDLLQSGDGQVVGVSAGMRTSGNGVLSFGTITSHAVVLATGGFGQVFATSTNPADVTGDGLAMATRAGAELSDMEFVQFHPTVLFIDRRHGQSPLITEALRGAGATIVDDGGLPVMTGRHVRGDLAPRDVVSLAMFERMRDAQAPLPHLWLDARHIGRLRLETEFPTALSLCRGEGIDPVVDRIPVAPGAHYACGGIRAHLDGTTSLRGLYAIGEAAATGIHGANRLASNSLTEAVCAGRRFAQRFERGSEPFPPGTMTLYPLATTGAQGMDPVTRSHLTNVMSSNVGIIRDRESLEGALDLLSTSPRTSTEELDLASLEATNLHTVSTLVAYAALLREESRGCHQRSDFPITSARWRRSSRLQLIDGVITSARRMAYS